MAEQAVPSKTHSHHCTEKGRLNLGASIDIYDNIQGSAWKLVDQSNGAVCEILIAFCPFCGHDLLERYRTQNEKDNCLMH